MFTYDEGKAVDLVAEADEGYIFVNWTGNVSAIADVYAASTTITMNGHYSITANFAIAIEIWDWYDLDAVRDNLEGHHTLMNDLDSTTAGYEDLASPTANGGNGWEPIESFVIPSYGCGGGILDVPPVAGLKGTFAGQGYEIRDLFINRPGEGYVGLFGSVDEGGIIKNVGVVNVTVTGSMHVGVLAGLNFYGTVSNSYSTGSVTGDYYVGGLVGEHYGTVSNSYSTSNVTGNWYVGGLMGQKSDTGIISNSYYNYDEVLINGENIITIGALFDEDFDEWLANDKFLDVNERLSQEDDYYLINDLSDFKQLLAFGQDSSLKFRLKNDLDLAAEPNFYIPYFAGEFDGNGHKISNLSFDFDFVSTVGLFGCLASGGKVTDLGVENVNVTGAGYVGGLVGLNWDGTVSNSYSTGSMNGNEYVGGLVGLSWGYMSNSYSSGNVTGDNHVGGLVGSNWGYVSNSYSTGSVTGTQIVGGLAGDNGAGTVSDSYSTGSVIGDMYVGGLVGWNTYFSTVSNSYSTGSVSGDMYVGGLVGFNTNIVSKSYSTGNVTGTSYVGGLVGRDGGGTVSNSFWDTETSGQDTSAGGTGKTTAQMKNITTFSGADWNIIAVANPGTRNPTYIWNIPTTPPDYPFLSWQP
jgi:hypothetical protein